MGGELILSLDAGTQSMRALVFDPRGHLRYQARVPVHPPYHSPQPGWAEQEPDTYWEALARACRMLWGQGAQPDSLAALALTGQRASVVNLDRQGRPLRPAILWLDGRRAERFPRVGGRWGLLFALAGLRSTLEYLQAEAEANWLWANQPDVWERTAHYLLLSGYLTHRLTGRYVDSVGCQVGYVPFDYRRLTWSAPSDWKWQALPVRRETLPELTPPARKLGEVTEPAARATGLPAGLPVVAAAADKACEALGAGCLNPSLACIGYGTTATVNVTSPRYLEPIRLIPPYPSAVPGAYNLEFQVYRGFWLVSWFREQFGQPETAAAGAQGPGEGPPVETLLDRLAEGVAPGSQGLVLHPYWSPGLRFPGPEARGAVVGFASFHTRAHFYRALLEGLAYAMREGRERIERRTGVPVRELRVCGGGSRSDLVMQITADVSDLPASRPGVAEASGLGAAVLAAVGAGLHRDLPTAVREMTRTGERFEPRREAVAVYDDLYRRVYRRLYPRLRPLYRELPGATGGAATRGATTPAAGAASEQAHSGAPSGRAN
ncbi:MAG: FGGY-family carbohydrate kinase [Bacillota bacterium]|nr:FGGY-family carbohydrate kinase [Bacillota bacterium]